MQTFIACKVDGHDYILILSSSKNNVHSIDVGTASSPQTRRSLVMTKEIIDSSIDPHLLLFLCDAFIPAAFGIFREADRNRERVCVPYNFT